MIRDGDVTLAESGAILEYLIERYGEGRLAPPRGGKDYVRRPDGCRAVGRKPIVLERR